MQSTIIASIDPETQELEPIVAVTAGVSLVVKEIRRVSSVTGNVYTLGWNLYAGCILIETYEKKREARWVRRHIRRNLKASAELIIV